MKRNKIKKKYLNQIQDINESITKIEKVQKVITNTLKSIGLILLLISWSSIPIIFMYSFGINYQNLPKSIKVLYLFTCDLSLISFLIFIYRKDLKRDLKNFFNKNFLSNLILSVRYWIVGLIFMLISNIIITSIAPNASSANEDSVRSLIEIAPWFMAFELSIYAPLTEEIIFRKSFREITNHKYIYALLSGFVFGGMHIISSLSNPTGIFFIIPYASLGITFALLYYRTNNIFSSITIHCFHNTLSLVLYLIGSMAS